MKSDYNFNEFEHDDYGEIELQLNLLVFLNVTLKCKQHKVQLLPFVAKAMCNLSCVVIPV